MAWLVPKHIPLPAGFIGFSPESGLEASLQRYSRHLPHWRKEGACYISTFRLRDSLPAEVMKKMEAQRQYWLRRLEDAAKRHHGQVPLEERAAWDAFEKKEARKLDLLLDEGHGECLLRHEEHRQPLVEALHHLDGKRVEMLAYAIMPNHAHVLCRPLTGHTLESLTGSWKRRSSQWIHQRLGRRGALWQDESWDRIIRDAEHYATAVRYIAKNPVVARLSHEEATVWLHPSITTSET
jgi:putative transposase